MISAIYDKRVMRELRKGNIRPMEAAMLLGITRAAIRLRCDKDKINPRKCRSLYLKKLAVLLRK